MKIISVILSAGIGSRMNSSTPKGMHKIGNAPMIEHLLRLTKDINSLQTIAVIGDDTSTLEQYLHKKCEIAHQKQRLGSGHAVLVTKDKIKEQDGILLVLYGDTPLINKDTALKLCTVIQKKEADICILAFNKAEPNLYGKLVTDENGYITKIVEYKDADEQQQKIQLCNSGIMALSLEKAWSILEKIKNDNHKKEYYLTDAVEIASSLNLVCKYIVDDEDLLKGANTKTELAELEATFQKLQRHKFLQQGVEIKDPNTVYFSLDTKIGKDVVVYPNNYFFNEVEIGNNVVIYPLCVLEGCKVGDNAEIGPFARLRPQTTLKGDNKVGNFVEIKKSQVGKGSKINHLSYIGDSDIGKNVNIGAGTITCNYDGKEKHSTIIEDEVFVGSNTALVAPVKIGHEAIIAAGSTITENVPAKSLAITRNKQVVKEGYRK